MFVDNLRPSRCVSLGYSWLCVFAVDHFTMKMTCVVYGVWYTREGLGEDIGGTVRKDSGLRRVDRRLVRTVRLGVVVSMADGRGGGAVWSTN